MSFNPNNRTPLAEPGRFLSAYSNKLKTSLDFPLESPVTRQEFKQECDINYILSQYELGYEITHINEAAPQYLDCSADTFREHMDYVAGAFSMFEELPAKLRARFGNDPAEFLDFCSQEKNRPEMAELGLLSAEANTAYFQSRDEVPQRPASPPAAPPSNDQAAPASTPQGSATPLSNPPV